MMATDGKWKCLLFCLLTSHLCVCLSHSTSANGRLGAEFAHSFTIRPSVYHGREKRQIWNTHQEDGHINDLSIRYELNNNSYILDLRLNRDLLSDGYFEKYSHKNGDVVERPRRPAVHLCQYQGHVRNVPQSWVALSTCTGLRGVMYDGRELYYIEPREGDAGSSPLDAEHLVWKHSDLTTNFTCGTHSALPHSSHNHTKVKRQIDPLMTGQTIRGPYKANSRSRYVELVLVVDNKSYENQDKDLKRVYRRCRDIANIVNALYAPLNIFVALVGIVVWSEKDEIQLSVKGDETLTNFLYYRRVRLAKEHPNDNAQLLTGIQFQGGVVGKALKGPMCTYEFSGGVAMDHSPTVGLVATTVAHEMGHNFGMEHDNDSFCECPDDKCIMAASSSAVSPTRWSSCSLENLAHAFEHGMDYCLRNKPVSLFEGPECGNMFVEPGEECDCGLPDRCDNPCCNPHTCRLHVNATCATGECCDLTTCQVKTAGAECRSAPRECDLPEYCTGKSEFCPNDLYKLDGGSCGNETAYCYQGSCRSHSDQCRLLWGPSGKGSDTQCYRQNTHGNKTGNCGYDKFNQTYAKCRDENIMCGLLHCSHLNERLEFGMESVAILSHSFFNVDSKIIPCRTANVDLGLQDVDPGLVPNGAKCGHDKMCVNQSCVLISSVLKSECPAQCNFNGVCNNLGKCHCNVGFAPPFCDYPGPGGSEDGGPASDPNVRNLFVTAMFIIFLGIVPILAILFCCWYFCRDRRQREQLWAKIQGAPKLSLPTRGSPDFTQPPSSNSSTTSSPSQSIQHQRPPFWRPVTWLWNKSSSRPASAASSNGNALKSVDISRPLPLRPTKLSGLQRNGSNVAPAAPASSSLTTNLIGQYKGCTLSPLSAPVDSSFDSADSIDGDDSSATTSTVVRPAPPPPQVDGTNRGPKDFKANSIVAARASFFSGNASAVSSAPTVIRPAPTVPGIAKSTFNSTTSPTAGRSSTTVSSTTVRPSITVNPTAMALSSSIVKPPVTTSSLGRSSTSVETQPLVTSSSRATAPTSHTEIVITKTVMPAITEEPVDSGEKSNSPQKRPLSTPNAFKGIFNKQVESSKSSDVSSSSASLASTNSGSSTFQKVASLFKPTPPQVVNVPVPEAPADPTPPNDQPKPSTLPRNQSIKAAKINRESLRQLEISNPIPQNVIELPTKVVPVRPAPDPPAEQVSPTSPSKIGISSTLPRLPKTNKVHFAEDVVGSDAVDGEKQVAPTKAGATVERAESMRLRGVTNRPNIPQFGSMRAKRPLSVPFARPKSPPPNPPNAIGAFDGSKSSPEAIYASIEDLIDRKEEVTASTGSVSKSINDSNRNSAASDGLLSEIVSELKKKNLDDPIYSATGKKAATTTGTAKTTSTTTTPPKTTTTNTKPVITSSAAPTIAAKPIFGGSSLKTTAVAPATTSSSNVPAVTSAASVTTTTSASTLASYKPYSSALRSRYTSAGTSGSVTTPAPIMSTFAPLNISKPAAENASSETPVATSAATVKLTKPSLSHVANKTPTTTTSNGLSGTVALKVSVAGFGGLGETPVVKSVTNNVIAPPVPSQPPVGTAASTLSTSTVNKPVSTGAPLKLNGPETSKLGSNNAALKPVTQQPVISNGTNTAMSPPTVSSSSKTNASAPNGGVKGAAKPTAAAAKVTPKPAAINAANTKNNNVPGGASTNKPAVKSSSIAIRLQTTTTATIAVAAASKPSVSSSSSMMKNHSHVQSMQQKFDGSSKTKSPTSTPTSTAPATSTTPAGPIKSKTNPKR